MPGEQTQDLPAALVQSPLRGRAVLVTRTPDRAAGLLELLRERGAEPVLVPVQEAEPVTGHERQELLELLEAAARGPVSEASAGSPSDDGAEASSPVPDGADVLDGSSVPSEPLWLVVTSANTVRALHRLAEEVHGRGLGDLLGPGLERGLRVAAVGPATAAELQDHGVPVHLQPHRTASAAGLLETWADPEAAADSESSGTVLLPQSAAASPELARGLEQLGWRVRRRVAYRMAPWPAAHPLVPAPAAQQDGVRTAEQARRDLADGTIDGVILTAPSATRALADGLVRAPSTALAAIGEPTRTAVVELGLQAVVAESTGPLGLVEALERAVAAPPGSVADTPAHRSSAQEE